MTFGARLRLAFLILFRRKIELVHCQDGHAAARAEQTLQSIHVERRKRGDSLTLREPSDVWQVEATFRVFVPWWFEATELAPGLAVVAQDIRQTVAVLRWDS